jgi:hypothetical protein
MHRDKNKTFIAAIAAGSINDERVGMFIIFLPLSVSWYTTPSSLTAVPGSHGPRESGSVMVAISLAPSDVEGGGLPGAEEEPEVARSPLS